MSSEKIIPAVILLAIGLLLFFNNKNMAKGAARFYQKFYSEKNLLIMFKVAGVILILGGLVLIFIK